eukprot:4427892-Lingulodinium_polyedra.AAC.1
MPGSTERQPEGPVWWDCGTAAEAWPQYNITQVMEKYKAPDGQFRGKFQNALRVLRKEEEACWRNAAVHVSTLVGLRVESLVHQTRCDFSVLRETCVGTLRFQCALEALRFGMRFATRSPALADEWRFAIREEPGQSFKARFEQAFRTKPSRPIRVLNRSGGNFIGLHLGGHLRAGVLEARGG